LRIRAHDRLRTVYLAAMTTPPYPGQDPQYPNAQPQNSPSQPPQYQPSQYQPQYQPPQNPYPGGGYPSGGYPGQGQQGPAPVAPGPVKGAFLVYVVVAVLALVSLVLSVTSSVWQQAIDDNPNTSGIDAQSLVNTVKIVAVVVGVIFIALYLFFAFKMRAGRNWARIVLTVLSALSILSSTSASSSVTINNNVYRSTGSQTFSWIGTVLAIVAIVLMFLPASNAYFSASKAARQRQLQ
jgi:hypothetical protein